MPVFRVLTSGDEAVLEAFLKPRMASSMILTSNSRAVGLIDRGERYHGTYAGVFERDGLIGVVGHFWNCNSILQVPARWAAELCAYTVRASGRPLTGMLGPSDQVGAVLYGMDIKPARLRLDSIESLYELRLSELKLPPALQDGRLRARAARPADLDTLAAWRAAFCIEALHDPDTPELHSTSRKAEQRGISDGHIWLAELDGEPVATSGWNAVTAEAVQIGGVYTPPALRGRGYARAAVAQSLLDARARGAVSSVLFTGDDNFAARSAYLALGYQRIGDYRIAMLRNPAKISAL